MIKGNLGAQGLANELKATVENRIRCTEKGELQIVDVAVLVRVDTGYEVIVRSFGTFGFAAEQFGPAVQKALGSLIEPLGLQLKDIKDDPA